MEIDALVYRWRRAKKKKIELNYASMPSPFYRKHVRMCSIILLHHKSFTNKIVPRFVDLVPRRLLIVRNSPFSVIGLALLFFFYEMPQNPLYNVTLPIKLSHQRFTDRVPNT